MTQFPPPVPLTSIIARLTIGTLFVALLLVASIGVEGSLQQAFTLVRSLVSDASQVLANALARTLHGADPPHITRQPPRGREIPNLHPIDYLALTLWGSLFTMIVAYLVYLECAQYWARVWDDQGRVPPGRQVRRHTDHAVSSAAPASADDDPAPSSGAEAHDARNGQASVFKGRQPSIATATNYGSASRPNEPIARTSSPPLIREDEDQLDNANVTSVTALGSSSSTRTLTGTIQAPSLYSEPPADPPSTSEETCLAHEDSAAKRACSLPEPRRPDTSQTPSRNPSLPHPNYKRTPPLSTKTNPLQTTLYGGSKYLGPPLGIQWFILFIAVTINENSEHDLHCFEEMLNQSTPEPTSIYFESLAGPHATPDKIRAKLTSLYLRAGCVSDDSLVFVFLTGAGDESNRMCLLNGNVLTEDNIRGYISDVQRRSGLINVRTVPVIFDICRVNKDMPRAEMCQLVEMMWSCSRGQQAHAVGFANIPSSCFLLALFWASYDVSCPDSPDFEKAFRSRLGQLVRIRRYSHDYWLWKEGKCVECGGGECTPPGPQDPEGGKAGWDVLASLGALIMARYPDYVRNIHQELTERMRHCEEWEASKITTSSSGSQSEAIDHHASRKEEHRGATQHVAAASAMDVAL